jgi:hypothetical protein
MKASKQKNDNSPRLLTNGPQPEPTHEQIALKAYSLWEQQGRPQNQEIAIWLQAETSLRQSENRHGLQP